MDDTNKTEEVQKAFSEIAAEFAAETDKTATERPEEMKAENLPEAQQMEFNSKFFKMYNIQFCNLMDQLPKKSVARVVKRLVAYPLETPENMTWTSDKEKNAFLIGNQLIEVKYLMFKYVMTEQITKETMEKLKADAASKEGVTNGENKAN